ncbi:MAG: peptidylprolyl isomerase [Chitinispirillales bacterium]|jgi:peptidylprolyl isomerase|nr:peptidylprolyl isomerase [Chitinispirillales bacterium]
MKTENPLKLTGNHYLKLKTENSLKLTGNHYLKRKTENSLKLTGNHYLKRKFLMIGLALCAINASSKAQGNGLFAELETSKGTVMLQLDFEKAPLTTANFVGLAEGTIKNSKGENARFYDGLTFHRVEPGFVIQGGDPRANGTGGPGYQFPDEFHPDLRHNSEGILSMANAGPGSNGSQFFITLSATPFLDNRHAVFGKVVKGMDVVRSIQKGDVIQKVNIIRSGKKAREFKADQESFMRYIQENAGRKERSEVAFIDEQKKIIKEKYASLQKTENGILYKVEKEGNGKKPKQGQTVIVHYTGSFLDGKVFDSSRQDNKPLDFQAGVREVIEGWDLVIMDMREGERRTVVLPPELAYGKSGAGGVIPPNAYLVFDMELVELR